MQPTLTKLLNQTKASFFSIIEDRQQGLLAIKIGDALAEIVDEIGRTIDSCLDERNDTYTQTLMLCCLESPDLFCDEPDALSCITDTESPGQVNAQHCVYHNLYDLLKNAVEHAFEEWHRQPNR